jgi:predicted kinase
LEAVESRQRHQIARPPSRPALLLHLNGLPGVGKSTLAKRYAQNEPGTMCCEIDRLRQLVSGWRDDFVTAGELIRPAALALVTAYLESGHDVVLPQLIVDTDELALFETAADSVGATYVHCLLEADVEETIQRFHQRHRAEPPSELAEAVLEAVADAGGDQALRNYDDGLRTLLDSRPDTVVIRTRTGDEAGALTEVLRAVASARIQP